MPDFRAALGRGGDRIMGHLTPGEAVIPRGAMTPKLYAAFNEALSKQGMMPEQYVVGSGYNSINPMTGQPEFQGLSFSRSRDRFDNDPNFGGDVDFSRPDRVGSSNPTGREGRESGGLSFTRARDPVVYNNDPNFGGTVDFSQPTRTPRDPDQPSTDDQIQEFLSPLAPGYTADGGLDLGFLETLPLVGPLVRAGNRFGGEIRPTTRARLERLAATRRDPDRMQGMSREREERALSFTRPVEEPMPAFLGLSSAMSPLQMRSAIASRAIAGQGGEYTSPEAATFYDNLLQRALISDTGALSGLDTLLPIDLQYLAQIRGIENPADTQSLLTALVQ